ncbi:MlaD family protein [Salinispira pacifica]
MRFRIKFANQLVGVFVLLALAFLLFILASMGINQHWFEKRHYFRSDFASARGINVGMNVTFKGFAIGKVTEIRLNKDNRVDVRFFIRDEYYPRVYENSVLQLTANPLGLGGGLVFHPGSRITQPLPDHSLIPSWDSAMAREWRDRGLVQAVTEEDMVTNLMGQVGPLVTKVNDLLASTQSVLTTVDGALKGTDTGPLGATLANVDSLVGGMSRSVATLNAKTLGNVNEMVANLATISSNMAILSEELKTTRGLVPRLLDAKGSIATLLDDQNRLFDRIDSIMASLQATAADVKQLADFLKGSTPQLSTMLDQTQKALSTGQDVLTGVKNNPLIRGGIPKNVPQPPTFRSYRDDQF